MIKSTYYFYKRHVNGLSSQKALQGDYPLKGGSPFGDGTISISADGAFECEATGKNGSMQKFLSELYPLLTMEGIANAIAVESIDENELHPKRCEDQLTSFREDDERQLDFSYLTRLNAAAVTDLPLWSDGNGNRLNYLHRSVTGQPICNISWQPGTRNETIIGIPRLTASDADRIWFVENPLQAELVKRLLDEPAYMRPSAEALEWNEYRKLAKGKIVVLLTGNDKGSWEQSFYPLLQELYRGDIDVKSVSAPALTRGQTIEQWLAEGDSKSILLEEVKNAKTGRLSPYDRQAYYRCIQQPGPSSLYFPQDVSHGMLWYGLKSGEVTHSQPCNILSVDELENKYNLKTKASSIDTSFRLTKVELFNIVNSTPQFTPRRTFETLRDFILRYYYFKHDQMATLLALWIMGTYVYQLFPAYGYLHFNGRHDTGKTSLIKLIALCAFNGLLQDQATRAVSVKRIDRLGGTICFDEYEASSSGTGDEFVQMINSGYKKGGTISKMSGNKEVSLHSYSPKAFGGIDDVTAEALKSRMITINTIAMPPSANIQEWNDSLKEINDAAVQIRRGGYALGLTHHETIHRYYRRLPRVITLPNSHNLTTRQRELMRPLIAIARLVDTGGSTIAESTLMKAFELSIDLEAEEQAITERLLAEQLEEWSSDADFEKDRHYRVFPKRKEVRIENGQWIGTALAEHVGSKDLLLGWFKDCYGLDTSKGTRLTKQDNSKSCTVFPVDVIINGKPFTDWFTLK